MTNYKAAKEAFVSHNTGSTILSINAVSLTALSSYTLYAVISSRLRSHPFVDYITTIFPLLLAITSLSSHPILLNTIILSISLITALLYPSRTHQAQKRRRKTKPPGAWLDESDSDEEPVEQPMNGSDRPSSTLIRLPSDLLNSAENSPSPRKASPASLGPEEDRPRWRRRHSPTPSTHTHTAIDIPPTPDSDIFTFPPKPSLPQPPYLVHSEAEENLSARFNSSREQNGRLPFLSVYRAHMMIMTVHSILAVDFPVFPREFGKCEDFGTSLMDVGVGSFVFSLGIVTSRVLGPVSKSDQFRSASTPWLLAAFTALRKAAPVIALGVVRIIMVKGAEYPEHVTEYGVHWNFFFTLGVLPFFGTLLRPIRQHWMHWSLAGFLLSTIHQIFLQYRLESWILSPVRHGLIGMNKEGIVSLPGYLAIFFLGLAIGEHVMRASAPPKIKSAQSEDKVIDHYAKRRTELVLELLSYTVMMWSALGITHLLQLRVSRRMANLPYVLWIAAYNTSYLLGYLTLESVLFPVDRPTANPPAPLLLEAVNKNGLAVFLIANLLTGAVNVSIKTMYVGDKKALLVLVGYSVVVCTVAWGLRAVRLWI